MKKLSLFLLVIVLALPLNVWAIPPIFGTTLPTTCSNGQTVIWNSTNGKWDTCSDLSGGGDITSVGDCATGDCPGTTMTWGAGSAITWTFNASSGADPTFTFGNGTFAVGGRLSATTYGSDGTVTDAELLFINSLSSNAQDQLNAKAPVASPTFTGKATTAASAAVAGAGFNLPHGVAPNTPANGDCWTTTAGGLYCYINGATVGPYAIAATQALLHIDDILTALGIASEATHFGTFTGITIPDSSTAKAALQALETALELKAPIASPTFTGTVGGITATMVGLGNVTNESKATMFTSPTFTGKATTAASAAVAGAGFNLPHGVAPNTPTNGDCWTTTGGLYCYINGATVGPLGSSTGDIEAVWGCSSGDCSALTAAAGDSLNASSADSSTPYKVGTVANLGTCTGYGSTYFATDTSTLYTCINSVWVNKLIISGTSGTSANFADETDSTKKAQFDFSAITTSTIRAYAWPNAAGKVQVGPANTTAGKVFLGTTTDGLGSWSTGVLALGTNLTTSTGTVTLVGNSANTSSLTLPAGSLTLGTMAAAATGDYSVVAGSSSIVTVGALAAGSLATGFTPITVPLGGTGLTAGTEGGIPWYTTTTALASSALLAQYGVMIGGGIDAAPSTVTPSTTTTYALFAGSTVPGFRAIAVGDLPAVTVLGAATGTSLKVTGNLDGLAPTYITTAATTITVADHGSQAYFFNNTTTAGDPITYTLPVPIAGMQYCIKNYTGKTGILTFDATVNVYIDFEGVNSIAGGVVHSGGALGDAACVVAADTTHWVAYKQVGTWSLD